MAITMPPKLMPAPTTIAVTLRTLLDAQPALTRLANERLPIKLAYNVARMLKALQPELDEFFKQRTDLVKRYGLTRPATPEERPTHGPEVTEVPKDQMADFRREIDELADVEVLIAREPLRLDGCESISAADLIALGPLVAEDA